VSEVYQELQETSGDQALGVQLETVVYWEQLDHRECRVQLAPLATQVTRDLVVHKVNRVRLGRWDLRVRMERPGLLVLPDDKDNKDFLVLLEQLEHREQLEIQDTRDHKAFKATPVQPDLLV